MIGEVPKLGMGSSVWEYLCPQPALLCLSPGACGPTLPGQIIFCIVPILSPLTALPGGKESQHQLLAPAANWRFLLPIIQCAGSRD